MKIPKFTPEEIEKFVEEFSQEQNERVKTYKEFFLSERFKEVMSQIKMAVDTFETVGDNPYSEPFLFGNVTNDEFLFVFYALGYKEISGLEFKDEDGDFSPQSLVFEGLKFSQVHGQGTAFFVEKA